MFLLQRPSDRQIQSLLAAQQHSSFSYSPLELTRSSSLAGYTVDHNRVQLGSGAEAFSAGVRAIQQWKMFDLGWVHLFSDQTSIESGATVAIVVNHLRFWSINACRIVYVIEESDRYGFAYGTLAEHAERGEERFMVEHNREDDGVWYDIFAVSKPGPMAKLAYPFTRTLQKRFARDSLQAMRRATSGLTREH